MYNIYWFYIRKTHEGLLLCRPFVRVIAYIFQLLLQLLLQWLFLWYISLMKLKRQMLMMNWRVICAQLYH